MKRPLLLLSILAGASLVWGGIRLQAVQREERLSKATLEELQASAKERPDQADLLMKLGAALIESGEQERAEPILRRSLELDSSSEAGWVQLSRSFRNDPDAIRLLEERLKTMPDSREAQSELSRRQLASGDAASALKSSEKAITAFPDAADAWAAYGEVLAAVRRQEAAETAFRHSLRLEDNAEVRLSLARVFIPLQRYEKVEVLCAPLISAKPVVSVSKRQRLRALIYHAGSRLNSPLSEAELASIIAQLEEAEMASKSLAPGERFLPFYFLGEGLLRCGKPEAAIASLEHCVGLSPRFPGGLYSLSRAYRLVGDAAKSDAALARHTRLSRGLIAMEALNSRLEENPDDANALLKLAKTLAEIGSHEEAAAVCRRLVESGKLPDEANRLMKTLQ